MDFELQKLLKVWSIVPQFHLFPAYPFGVVPVLSWDGEVLSQSMTIARFVAKKTGLAGAYVRQLVK